MKAMRVFESDASSSVTSGQKSARYLCFLIAKYVTDVKTIGSQVRSKGPDSISPSLEFELKATSGIDAVIIPEPKAHENNAKGGNIKSISPNHPAKIRQATPRIYVGIKTPANIIEATNQFVVSSASAEK